MLGFRGVRSRQVLLLSQNFTLAISARNLGVTLDNNKNFRQHISQTCRCSFYHIRDLRQYMSFAVAKTTATALVSSRLDYCNSIYHNIALKDILKLQRSLPDIALFLRSAQLPSKHFRLSNQYIYINCSLLQNSLDNFDHIISIYFLFPLLRQM